MAKKTSNEIVLAMLEKVQQKKNEIKAASKKPVWKTNCTIGYDPKSVAGRINIMTRTDLQEIVDMYAFLLQRADYLKRAAEQLGVEVDLTYMGYTIADWCHDLKARADQLSIEAKKRELDELDKRVNKLVTPDQRREMELEVLKAELDMGDE
jgi:hypothetical protein